MQWTLIAVFALNPTRKARVKNLRDMQFLFHFTGQGIDGLKAFR